MSNKKNEKSVLQMIRERQARMDLNPDLSEMDLDMPWPLLERAWTSVYCEAPIQSENISYHDFMMELKEMAAERQRSQIGVPLDGWHKAEVESTRFRDMLRSLKTQRPEDDDEDDY